MRLQQVASFLSFCSGIYALTNVTIDDESSLISYSGVWEPPSEHQSSLSFGGGLGLSRDRAAKATFTFNGVAVYYMAPQFPTVAFANLSLDGGTPIRVSLADGLIRVSALGDANIGDSPSTRSVVLWGQSGLSNSRHTLEVTLGVRFAVVDAFIFTVDEEADNPSVIARPSSSSSTSSSTTSTTSTSSIANPTLTLMNTFTSVSQTTTSSMASASSVEMSSNSSPPGDLVSTSLSSPTQQSDNAGASFSQTSRTLIIALSVTGGVLCMAIGAAILLFCRRRRQRDVDDERRLDNWLQAEGKHMLHSPDPFEPRSPPSGILPIPASMNEPTQRGRANIERHGPTSSSSSASPTVVPFMTMDPESRYPNLSPLPPTFDRLPNPQQQRLVPGELMHHQSLESSHMPPRPTPQWHTAVNTAAYSPGSSASRNVVSVNEKQVVLSFENGQQTPAVDTAFANSFVRAPDTPPAPINDPGSRMGEESIRPLTGSAPPAYRATEE